MPFLICDPFIRDDFILQTKNKYVYTVPRYIYVFLRDI